MKQLRRYFLTGLVVVLPTVVSFYIFIVVGNWLDGLLGGMFRGETIRDGGIPRSGRAQPGHDDLAHWCNYVEDPRAPVLSMPGINCWREFPC